MEGSGAWVRPVKYSTLLPLLYTLPEGSGPSWVGLGVLLLKVAPEPGVPPVTAPSLNPVGVPEVLKKITEVVQRSTTWPTTPWLAPRNRFCGPKGSSQMPLARRTLGSSKLSKRLSKCSLRREIKLLASLCAVPS